MDYSIISAVIVWIIIIAILFWPSKDDTIGDDPYGGDSCQSGWDGDKYVK